MEPVIYSREGDVQTFTLGVPGLESLVVDQTGVPTEQRNGLAKQLLASAALSCYGTMRTPLFAASGPAHP